MGVLNPFIAMDLPVLELAASIIFARLLHRLRF